MSRVSWTSTSSIKLRRKLTVILALLLIPLPLPDTRSTSIGQYGRTDILESTLQPVFFDCSADKLRARSNEEWHLRLESSSLGLLGDRGDSGHVFVG